jgi:hypothetical protein
MVSANVYQTINANYAGGDLVVHTTSNTTGPTERFRVAGNGNIGIATATPAYPLDVNGAARINGTTWIGQSCTINGSAAPQYPLDVYGSVRVNANNTANNKVLVLQDNNSTDTLSTASNFVGFGVNASVMRYQAPTGYSHKWYTMGSNTLTLDYLGNLTVTANMTANSDARLKTDLVAIPDALAKISAIGGYTYRRTDLEGSTGSNDVHKRYAGVVAQEVREVLPEVVHEDADSGLLSVAYGNMAGLFVEGIKELRASVDALATRVSELESALPPRAAFDALEARVAELERILP